MLVALIFILIIALSTAVGSFLLWTKRRKNNEQAKADQSLIITITALIFVLASVVGIALNHGKSSKSTLSGENPSIKLIDSTTNFQANSKNVATVTARTKKGTKVYLLSSDGELVTSTVTPQSGKFKLSVPDIQDDSYYYLTTDRRMSKQNEVNVKSLANHTKIKLEESMALLDESNKEESKQESEESAQSKAESESTAKKESQKKASSASSESAKYSNYTSIEKKLDIDSLYSYSDDDLFEKGGNVILKDYYIQSLGADPMHQYHVLVAPSADSDKRFLIVFKPKHGQKLVEGTEITAYGMTTGKSHVNSSQINAGISEEYEGDQDVLFTADEVK